jgi:hypothetical protein
VKGVPEILDKIADTVLAYRPKSKAKKPRKRKKANRAGKTGKRQEIAG